MADRPILMSAPMVRAILAGTKTQTRRVVKHVGNDDGFVLQDYGRGWWPYRSDDGESPMKGDNEIPHACPYGQPGDRLWVRETWTPDPPIDDSWASTEWSGCGRRIDGVPERFQHPRFCCYSADWLHGAIVWRPSIHMPRWASRITLEVVGVRVERLQDISGANAIAEGVTLAAPVEFDLPHQLVTPAGRRAYARLWDQINGPGSWDANPWVWVVEFKMVAPC